MAKIIYNTVKKMVEVDEKVEAGVELTLTMEQAQALRTLLGKVSGVGAGETLMGVGRQLSELGFHSDIYGLVQPESQVILMKELKLFPRN